MKKGIKWTLIVSMVFLGACDSKKPDGTITFATSAMYPPFEYKEHGELKGYDIDLANLIAKELGKGVTFEDVQFSTILPLLENGYVDAAISTLTITEEREKNFDFSDPYYVESLATVFESESPITDKAQLSGKRVACQLGSTMEIWIKKHAPEATLTATDNNNQAIESLKVGHVDAVLMDGVQGMIFSKKNPGLSYVIIAKSDNGYGIAVKKGSPLKNEINDALKTLEEKGEIKNLQQKWFGSATKWKE